MELGAIVVLLIIIFMMVTRFTITYKAVKKYKSSVKNNIERSM